jgi:hypothetical protein
MHCHVQALLCDAAIAESTFVLLHRSRDTTLNSYWKNIQPKLALSSGFRDRLERGKGTRMALKSHSKREQE